jgi:signal transduction histidine kinase
MPPGREHTERVVAIVRLILATASLAAVYLDPTTPARYVTLAYGILVAYALYSLLLATTRAPSSRSRRIVIAIHLGDIVAATVLTLFTEGPSRPFFVLFGFTLLAAGYRWGLWETLSTGLASVLLLGLEAVLISNWLEQDGLVEGQFELNRFILRCTYLLLLAVMVGYLAEQQRLARAEATSRAGAEERARVARELHDGIVQSLIGLKMQVTILRSRCGEGDPTAASLEHIETLLDGEVVELRSLMFQTPPIDRDPPELNALLADLVEQFGRATNISSRLVSRIDAEEISARSRREIARIVQEALVNVRKHSGARHVLVSVSTNGRHCSLVVDDDGRGFDFEGRLSGGELDDRRKGPRTIKERVRLLGGSLVVDSRPNAGARVEISVPLDA